MYRDLVVVDLWVILACCILLIGYSVTAYYLHSVMKHDGINQETSKNIKLVIRRLGLYPLAYFFQWFAYGLLKTGVISATYTNVLIVVTPANTGGILNFFIYYPLLLSQVKREEEKEKEKGNEKCIGKQVNGAQKMLVRLTESMNASNSAQNIIQNGNSKQLQRPQMHAQDSNSHYLTVNMAMDPQDNRNTVTQTVMLSGMSTTEFRYDMYKMALFCRTQSRNLL